MDLDDPEVSIRTEPSTPLRSSSEVEISAQYSAPIPARLPKTDLTRVFNRFNKVSNSSNNDNNNNVNNNDDDNNDQSTPGRRINQSKYRNSDKRTSRTPKTVHAKTALDQSPYFSPRDSVRRERRAGEGIRVSLTPVRYYLRRKRRRSSIVNGKIEYTSNYAGPVTIDFLRFFCQKSIEERGQDSSKKLKTGNSPSNSSPLVENKSPSEFDYSLPLPKANFQSPPQHPFTEIQVDELNPFLQDDVGKHEILSPIPIYEVDVDKKSSGRPVSYLERILAAQARKTRRELGDDDSDILEESDTYGEEKEQSTGDSINPPKTPANPSVSDLVIEELTIGTSRLGNIGEDVFVDKVMQRDEEPSEVTETGGIEIENKDDTQESKGEHDNSLENVQDQFFPNNWQYEDDLDIPLIDDVAKEGERGEYSSGDESDEVEEGGILKDQFILEEGEPSNLIEEEVQEHFQVATKVDPPTRMTASFALKSKKSASSLPINLVKTLMKTVVKNSSVNSRLPVKPIAPEACDFLQEISDIFMEGMVSDLEAYSSHRTNGKSHQINIKDVLLLLERTGQIPGRRRQQDQINVISRMAHDALPLELLVGLEKSLTQNRPILSDNNDFEDDNSFTFKKFNEFSDSD
ncbi:hypothetical protein CLIB1423_05S00584 [[Candida] railenensis]|uniref:CENP-T/Histone H4 histone fold domain-containing protein n=1 Tax=[Candida] railenensis TaxID=45579 RepID=A0A9P0QNC1_9ASCO|nr:hypothetical protein CLIB1423_05S00584 [[Candida] railenensis]